VAPAFAYRAVDAAGARIRGREEAASPELLARVLERRGLLVLDVADATAERRGFDLAFRFGERQAVLDATRALAALLPAGMPLSRALDVAANLASGSVAVALAAVRLRVERGEALAVALAEHRRHFPALYVGVVRAGEKSGDLDGAFARLATQLEREAQLRERLLSAAIYPILLGIVGGAALLILVLLVLPRFASLLQDAGASLPASTAALLGLSRLMRRFWPIVAGAAVLGPVAATTWARTPSGRRAFAALLLGTPVVRTLRRGALGARFGRLLGVLLGGGAPLLSALGDAEESLADPIARDDAARIRAAVREGAPLNQALAASSVFPPVLAQLVAVGEESGKLEEFLRKAADILEERTERSLQRLVALLEPAMIVAFGVIIGVVALSLLQAIYGLNAGVVR